MKVLLLLLLPGLGSCGCSYSQGGGDTSLFKVGQGLFITFSNITINFMIRIHDSLSLKNITAQYPYQFKHREHVH